MKVLFLDFDGVLTYTDHMRKTKEVWDPVALNNLHDVVQATGCKIVVSSSWRHNHSIAELSALLSMAHGIVIDKTPGMGQIFTHDNDGRGNCITQWLMEHGEGVRNWAIVDDSLGDMHPWMLSRIVATKSHEGLTWEKASELIALLGIDSE